MLSLFTQKSSLRSACRSPHVERANPAENRMHGAVLLTALCVMIAGCGIGSNSLNKVGPILIASSSGAKGQVSSLAVASTVKLSMMPIGDSTNAGIDWMVNCGGNPVTGSISNGACGTLTPRHTPGGATTWFTAPSLVPIGTTVTFTASMTANPSQSSSASLTIVSLPIAVSFSASVPTSLLVSGIATFQAQVTNDPVNAGVIWTATCGSVACGSFNPTTTVGGGTTYTAPAIMPAGGTVIITATSLTDTTKSVSATVTITAPFTGDGGPLAVSVTPTSVYVETAGSARTAHLTANVANDGAAAGVDWSLSCGASTCGQITVHTESGVPATFIGPKALLPGSTVTITAKSTTDPTVLASATATVVTTAPIVVTISTESPLPPTLIVGTQATVSAVVVPNTGNFGVNWIATCGSAGACGTFNLSPAHTVSGGPITFTAPSTVPAGEVVTIVASSPASTPSYPAMAATKILVPPPTLSFAQSPPTTMAGTTHAPVSAIVTNDVPPGGVTWTVQCSSSVTGGCGAISPYKTASGAVATYKAPPVTSIGTTVTIVASSTADPQVNLSSSSIGITPSTSSSISFVPLAPSQVQANATVNFNAAVANDATNGGVDWQICPSECGFFTTKAAVPTIPATTMTPYVPAAPAITATTVTAWPNNLPLTYTAPPQPPSSGYVVVLIAAHASPTTADSATVAIDSASNGPALHGLVQAGMQPIVGASVALYAAGISGYASASSQISAPGGAAMSTTDKNGNFTLPAGYSCPQADSQMYLVATGGQIGANEANPNLAFMTALGGCSSLGSTSVVLNEVTSIASAWATGPFAGNDALTGNRSYLYLGTSSSNLSGLANAFAAVNNLVDISTGQARYTVPSGNAAVPYAEINTLADILNACTATSGGVEGDGSACGTLFAATDVLVNAAQNYNSIAPLDTLQAAFNIAQHPVTNYGYQLDSSRTLYGLATLASPFQPIVPAQPLDWSIALNYTDGGGLSATSTVGSFALDSIGDLWITDTKAGSVIEWNAVGAALSPPAGYPAGGGPIAIDPTGNIWVSGNGSLTELTNLGAPYPGSPFGGVAGGGGDIAIDAQSNLWINNIGGVNEFNSLGTEVSPAVGYTDGGFGAVTAVGVDSFNNVWIGNKGQGFANFAELSNPGGQLIVNSQGNPGTVTPEIAADDKGDIWAAIGGYFCKVPPYAGKGTVLIPTCYAGGGGSSSSSGLSFYHPQGVAFDGAGTVWVASQGGGTNPIIQPSVLPVAPSLLAGSLEPKYLSSSTLSAGPLRVAVDGSGNVWVLLANNTVTEYVGVATPVVTPIALGVMNKKLAAKP